VHADDHLAGRPAIDLQDAAASITFDKSGASTAAVRGLITNGGLGLSAADSLCGLAVAQITGRLATLSRQASLVATAPVSNPAGRRLARRRTDPALNSHSMGLSLIGLVPCRGPKQCALLRLRISEPAARRRVVAREGHLPSARGATNATSKRQSAFPAAGFAGPGSIGVPVFTGKGSGTADVLKWADSAMYRAKDAGRNTVRFHGEMYER
jgi:hypothetical protein